MFCTRSKSDSSHISKLKIRGRVRVPRGGNIGLRRLHESACVASFCFKLVSSTLPTFISEYDCDLSFLCQRRGDVEADTCWLAGNLGRSENGVEVRLSDPN